MNRLRLTVTDMGLASVAAYLLQLFINYQVILTIRWKSSQTVKKSDIFHLQHSILHVTCYLIWR